MMALRCGDAEAASGDDDRNFFYYACVCGTVSAWQRRAPTCADDPTGRLSVVSTPARCPSELFGARSAQQGALRGALLVCRATAARIAMSGRLAEICALAASGQMTALTAEVTNSRLFISAPGVSRLTVAEGTKNSTNRLECRAIPRTDQPLGLDPPKRHWWPKQREPDGVALSFVVGRIVDRGRDAARCPRTRLESLSRRRLHR